jgi:hypothetical protein
MDDFISSSLEESKNEFCIRLCHTLTPHVIDGIRSLFNEAWNMCVETKEPQKYLMTFQNLISRIPKWNSVIIEEEKNRIIDRSGCSYLEDLITCVHIVQLKALTCIRVGNRQKKIDISIPKLDVFIHRVYILAARRIYSRTYLFQRGVPDLTVQRNQFELECLIQGCIMTAVRESVPTEHIIRAYLDESVEEEEEIKVEPVVSDADAASETLSATSPQNQTQEQEIIETPSIQNISDEPVVTRLKFNDYDSVLDMTSNEESLVKAPKTLERLEEISSSSALQKKMEKMQEDAESDDHHRIQIMEPFSTSQSPSLETVEIDLNPMGAQSTIGGGVGGGSGSGSGIFDFVDI